MFGIAIRSVHSDLKVVTQAMQATRSERLVTGPPHAWPPGTVTAGHVAGKPSPDGVRSSPPPQRPPSPPQPAHTALMSLSSAFVIAASALPSGHAGPPLASTAPAHIARASARAV